MRKSTGVMGFALLLLVYPFVAVSAQSLTGSPHDFTSNATQTVYTAAAGQCIVCHVPHATNNTAPLWGHDTSGESFTMYDSPTMDAAKPAGPGNVSLACLSCHDGLTAVDSYGGASGSATISGTASLGTNLTQDHPITIEYNAGSAEFNTRLTAGWAGTATDSLPLYGSGMDQVECGSCHNPHDYTGASATKFLRMSEASICTVCHSK